MLQRNSIHKIKAKDKFEEHCHDHHEKGEQIRTQNHTSQFQQTTSDTNNPMPLPLPPRSTPQIAGVNQAVKDSIHLHILLLLALLAAHSNLQPTYLHAHSNLQPPESITISPLSYFTIPLPPTFPTFPYSPLLLSCTSTSTSPEASVLTPQKKEATAVAVLCYATNANGSDDRMLMLMLMLMVRLLAI